MNAVGTGRADNQSYVAGLAAIDEQHRWRVADPEPLAASANFGNKEPKEPELELGAADKACRARRNPVEDRGHVAEQLHERREQLRLRVLWLQPTGDEQRGQERSISRKGADSDHCGHVPNVPGVQRLQLTRSVGLP